MPGRVARNTKGSFNGQPGNKWIPNLAILLLATTLVLTASNSAEQARNEIVTTYQRSLDALRRGNADAAMQMDTEDWISIVIGQKPRTRQEIEPFVRRDIESMKPPPDWSATWRPDYERGGTTSGIQIYDFKLDGDKAIVLCLVGGTRTEIIDGVTHKVWRGSHVRDTWIRTSGIWKRKMHEKLTINEQMIDGRLARQ